MAIRDDACGRDFNAQGFKVSRIAFTAGSCIASLAMKGRELVIITDSALSNGRRGSGEMGVMREWDEERDVSIVILYSIRQRDC